eukprot:Hpha_TRINITY_DN16797_c2_g1::TRINITY_DN16797_c2_g1_i1::g.79000::m.79000
MAGESEEDGRADTEVSGGKGPLELPTASPDGMVEAELSLEPLYAIRQSADKEDEGLPRDAWADQEDSTLPAATPRASILNTGEPGMMLCLADRHWEAMSGSPTTPGGVVSPARWFPADPGLPQLLLTPTVEEQEDLFGPVLRKTAVQGGGDERRESGSTETSHSTADRDAPFFMPINKEKRKSGPLASGRKRNSMKLSKVRYPIGEISTLEINGGFGTGGVQIRRKVTNPLTTADHKPTRHPKTSDKQPSSEQGGGSDGSSSTSSKNSARTGKSIDSHDSEAQDAGALLYWHHLVKVDEVFITCFDDVVSAFREAGLKDKDCVTLQVMRTQSLQNLISDRKQTLSVDWKVRTRFLEGKWSDKQGLTLLKIEGGQVSVLVDDTHSFGLLDGMKILHSDDLILMGEWVLALDDSTPECLRWQSQSGSTTCIWRRPRPTDIAVNMHRRMQIEKRKKERLASSKRRGFWLCCFRGSDIIE